MISAILQCLSNGLSTLSSLENMNFRKSTGSNTFIDVVSADEG